MSDQELRKLQHKTGCIEAEGVVATCKCCDKTWTGDQLVAMFLSNKYCVELEETTDRTHARLKRIIAEGQRKEENGELPDSVIHSVQNLHSSKHCKSCFKYDCECRYNLPKKSASKTVVQCVEEKADWVSWDGTCSHVDHFEIIPKRDEYDLFMNQYCPALSTSRLACNSNIKILMDGRESLYTVKYSAKDTQPEDTEGYDDVLKYLKL